MRFPSVLSRFAPAVAFVFVFTDSAIAKTPQEVFMRASPSVVVITVLNSEGMASALGSGVVIEASEVLTNCHITNQGDRYQVSRDGKSFEARLRYADRERDLCQMNVPGLDARAADIGLRKELQVGQRVYAIGAPWGLELTISEGLISSLRDYGGVKLIQTTAAMSAGSSGGGLFDEEGTLVGITTFHVAQGQNLNFALPIDWLVDLPRRAQLQEAPVSRGQRTLEEWTQQFIKFSETEDWQGMVKVAQDYVSNDPESWAAWSLLLTAYRTLHQVDRFVSAIRPALRRLPKRADLWALLGDAHSELNQHAEAVRAYQQALLINPNGPDLWSALGAAYENLQQYDRAIEAYQKSIRTEKNIVPKLPRHKFIHSMTWAQLGGVYLKAKQIDNAIMAYGEATSLSPNYAMNWWGLGRGYLQAKRYELAARAFEEAVRLDHKDAAFWYSLGMAYTGSKQLAKAVQAYQEALNLKSGIDGEVWYSLGATYAIQGNRKKVLEVYDVLRKLYPAIAREFFKEFVLP